MKKLIALIVAGLTVTALMAGCNKAPEGDNTPANPSGASPTNPKTDTPVPGNPTSPDKKTANPAPTTPSSTPSTGGASTGK
ncbi:MAG TPA: hypothetical protein VMI31_17515 [Fimbriimonadaceae bacterium]|nr:hypothetical protein [Fimbriimonadaceae bacterium]